MAVPFSNTKLRVPRGFQNLLEGLAREVLRSQPEELYTFGAQYFENLIKQREESGIDPTEHGAKLEDRFYNNKAFSQPEIDPSDPTQQDAALAIQTKFRQHAAKQEVEVIREEKAATKIQAGFRGHQGRTQGEDGESDETAMTADPATDPPPVKTPADEEVDIDLTDPEVEAAAVKIQASFKGFQTRKKMEEKFILEKEDGEPKDAATLLPERVFQQSELIEYKVAELHYDPPAVMSMSMREFEIDLHQEVMQVEDEIDIDLTDPEVEQAALKIQAGFKGMQARKEVKQKREGSAKSSIAEGGSAEAADTKPEESSEAAVTTEEKPVPSPKPAEEEIDIDLGDPEVAAAAVKIQAGFKGHQARKDLAARKSAGQRSDTAEVPAEPEEALAAVDDATYAETAPALETAEEPAADITEETPAVDQTASEDATETVPAADQPPTDDSTKEPVAESDPHVSENSAQDPAPEAPEAPAAPAAPEDIATTDQVPAAEQSPAAVDEAADAATEQAPVVADQAPAVADQAPAEVDQTPVTNNNNDAAPADAAAPTEADAAAEATVPPPTEQTSDEPAAPAEDKPTE